MHNYHFIASDTNAPLAECFPPPASCGRDGNAGGYTGNAGGYAGNAAYWRIVEGEPMVEDGCIELPDRPGLGLELNQEAIDRYRVAATGRVDQ